MLRFSLDASYLMTLLYKRNSNCLISFHAVSTGDEIDRSLFIVIFFTAIISFHNETDKQYFVSVAIVTTKYHLDKCIREKKQYHMYLCGGSADMHSLHRIRKHTHAHTHSTNITAN